MVDEEIWEQETCIVGHDLAHSSLGPDNDRLTGACGIEVSEEFDKLLARSTTNI